MVSNLLLYPYSLIPPLHLRKGGMTVIVAHNVGIEQFAVFARHVKGRMPEKFLKGESVAATIQQVFLGEGMTEKVD